ncbi:MAG: aminotransferase class V-fold PLP-dependent enzyme [Clostridiales bacterium]|jgi:cysteine sulfinate desulfinase/cysteine desulfurase-like protein|nr:aminotransferase class V-fold PLP-dependent enzyme [Clostridiales bacterium]
METVYLDNAATTRVQPETADFVRFFMTEGYFNIGASYPPASALAARVADARKFIAESMGARADELYFTGGATEANNLILRGAIRAKNKTLIVTDGEHASVYNTAQTLKSAYTVKFAPLKRDGRVDADKLLALTDENTALVSVIHVNNETGAVNDIAALCRAVKAKNPACLFHSDGVQAFAKLPINVKDAGVDFYTVSGHKAGAPKGIAALYMKKGVHLNPLITGGGQENGVRAGTENVPGIMGFYRALRDNAECTMHNAEWNGHFSLRLPVKDCPSKENSPTKKEKSVEDFLSGNAELSPQLKDNAQCAMRNAQLSDNAECAMHNAQIKDQSELLNSQFSILNSKTATVDCGLCTVHCEKSELLNSQFSILNSKTATVDCGLCTVDCKADKLKQLLRNSGLPLKFNGGEPSAQSPYITSVSFVGLRAETLSNLCAERGVIIGLGSACAASKEGNRVLAAMGLTRPEIDGNIRISFCAGTTDGEIERAAAVIIDCARKLLNA